MAHWTPKSVLTRGGWLDATVAEREGWTQFAEGGDTWTEALQEHVAERVEAAMDVVYGYLFAGPHGLRSAQYAVIAIEAGPRCVLPSCVFERVLREAIKADDLTDSFATWCQRAYGREVYEAIRASAATLAHGKVRVVA